MQVFREDIGLNTHKKKGLKVVNSDVLVGNSDRVFWAKNWVFEFLECLFLG